MRLVKEMSNKLRELAFQADLMSDTDSDFETRYGMLVAQETLCWVNENLGLVSPEAVQQFLKDFGIDKDS
jgi:hypothetical protein